MSKSILVVQSYDAGFDRVADVCCRSVAKYCQAQGHSYLRHRGTMPYVEHPSWSKIVLAAAMLPQYDYVWSVDADIFIYDLSTRLDGWLDDRFDISICRDGPDSTEPYRFNAGSVLWRNTDWTKAFLQMLLTHANGPQPTTWEQAFMQDYAGSSQINRRIQVWPHNSFNHDGGEFVIHLCNSTVLENKLEFLRNSLAMKGLSCDAIFE